MPSFLHLHDVSLLETSCISELEFLAPWSSLLKKEVDIKHRSMWQKMLQFCTASTFEALH